VSVFTIASVGNACSLGGFRELMDVQDILSLEVDIRGQTRDNRPLKLMLQLLVLNFWLCEIKSIILKSFVIRFLIARQRTWRGK
jgi:hypothetical protein